VSWRYNGFSLVTRPTWTGRAEPICIASTRRRGIISRPATASERATACNTAVAARDFVCHSRARAHTAAEIWRRAPLSVRPVATGAVGHGETTYDGNQTEIFSCRPS